jgi:hypothetical protein
VNSSINTAEHLNPRRLQHSWLRYLAWYILALLFLCALVAGFNAIIDPHARLLLVDRPGFNQGKVTLKTNNRTGKANAVRQCGYDNVILGTSRAENAFVVEHPAFSNGRTYNAALEAASMYEIRHMAEYAMRVHKPRTFLLGLDFFSFSAGEYIEDDFADSPLAGTGSIASLARYLFSVRTVHESVITLLWNLRGRVVLCAHDGEAIVKPNSNSAREFFDFVLWRYTIGVYRRYGPSDEHFMHLAELLRKAAAADVAVYAVILPVHATMMELQNEMELQDDFVGWKRRLVRTFEEANAGLPPERRAVLWDFTTYNEFTTEKIPPVDAKGDAKTMRWYSDPSHITKPVGNLILDRIYGTRSATATTAESFGVQLAPDTVEAVITAEAIGSELYRRENPDEIERIRQLVIRNRAK